MHAVPGLSGVAPRAWLGNYRVFTVPTPVGNVANTPEIIAAFESAVADGMQVINFSGGGPQIDPVNDALVEATANITAAGVVPVFSAGNDRDDFGLGTVGSPASAPDAIAVAAVSSTHVFAPAMTVVAPAVPGGLPQIPVRPDQSGVPPAWNTLDQTLVDVSAIVGTDGGPVDRYLCGPPDDPNRLTTTLPAHSLDGAIALAWRGKCTFFSKGERARAAGAAGLILVDNRPGETIFPGFRSAFPTEFIADVDGARLHDAMAATGGRAKVRVTREPQQIETGRSGVPTNFSSAGPTAFDHLLKPDISAPGGQILSATLTEFAGAPFAVFDGTSMSAPHISGAAALLLERHPGWTPKEVKSALMDSARPAWGDTARTTEANVELEGAGLANLVAADDPKIFTDPQSISLPDLDVTRGPVSRGMLVLVSDAGGGAGSWQVQVRPQTASAGASLVVPSTIDIAPGGETALPVVARAAADAVAGDETGFIVLTQGGVTRRVPYLFSVTRPGLESETATPLQLLQIGDTSVGTNQASVYRWPTGGLGRYGQDILGPVREDGAEHLYVVHVNEAVVNLGVSVVASSTGSVIDPWFLGSKNENDVQGYAGTPTNVNNFSFFDFELDYGAAGLQFPRQKEFFVSVDSGRDEFTGRSLSGRYLLRAWANDLDPPIARVMTTRVAAGRPTLVARTLDAQSGVDPFSLAIAYGQVTILAAAYDPVSGIAIFPLPASAPALKAGMVRSVFVASDYEEGKNINSVSAILPNTAFVSTHLRVVRGPAITWLQPDPNMCLPARARLIAVASATRNIRDVRYLDGTRQIGAVKRGVAGLYAATWKTTDAASGRHTLTATVTDAHGAQASADLDVKVCNAHRHR
jgi:subtilisin family serine protease